ncbi:hypothetical protein KCMC57_up27430 [Kitasatospora sp. CMC57]|uniref:Uncharacterized protein n=1 Tax=Kitasatospora sp. CMC57 TaxID=3231513 RepID=A0AB33K3A5_9ACTN
MTKAAPTRTRPPDKLPDPAGRTPGRPDRRHAPSRPDRPDKLPGELARAGGDHRAAFAAYEGRLREYAQGCQKGGDRTGKFLAPGRRIGGRLRDAVLNRPALLRWMLAEGRKVSTVDLPDYPAELGPFRAPDAAR